jgi:hypothetical protein
MALLGTWNTDSASTSMSKSSRFLSTSFSPGMAPEVNSPVASFLTLAMVPPVVRQ